MARHDYNKSKPSIDLNKFKVKWISEKFQPATIDFTEEFGEYLAKSRLTTSQIRNIFSEVKRIQAKVEKFNNEQFNAQLKEFLLLRPKIAYAAKRAGTRGIEDFKEVMDKAHGAVVEASDKVKAFKNFVDFFEATLAYHKAAGGRE